MIKSPYITSHRPHPGLALLCLKRQGASISNPVRSSQERIGVCLFPAGESAESGERPNHTLHRALDSSGVYWGSPLGRTQQGARTVMGRQPQGATRPRLFLRCWC
jgi:hypothetical protein